MYAVVFEECMGSIELINCKSMQVQVLGKVSTVSIDKTDGAQIYLSQGSLNAHVITAKSSEMNVMIPKGDGDFVSVFVGEIMTNIDIQQRRFRLSASVDSSATWNLALGIFVELAAAC
jgi:hypothetical protein